jgi:beta-lactam-binding protein with PASTA domain
LVSVSLLNRTLSVFRRISIVIAIGATFLFGLASTVYLSLRSPEVSVPSVLGKDRFEAEHILGGAGLNFRVRATRPSTQVKPDTVLFQLPRAGEVVKVGQTVAMDISRATKEGESSEVVAPPAEDKKPEGGNANANANVNSNENKPKRPKNTNKNGNENANSNSNSNPNANRSPGTENGNTNTTRNANVTPSNVNRARTPESGDTETQNNNKRPTPKPSPAARNDNREH